MAGGVKIHSCGFLFFFVTKGHMYTKRVSACNDPNLFNFSFYPTNHTRNVQNHEFVILKYKVQFAI